MFTVLHLTENLNKQKVKAEGVVFLVIPSPLIKEKIADSRKYAEEGKKVIPLIGY